MNTDETPTIPGEHDVEPDLDIEQENPDLEIPEVDEAIEVEPVSEGDLPEVDPYDDDEDAVLDDDEEN